MAGDGRSGRETLSGAVDRALRSPLYLVGGLLSGTIVTTGSEVLSTILLFWIRSETPVLPSPTPDPGPTPTPMTPPGTRLPGQGASIAYGSPIVSVLILVVAVVFLLAVIVVLARGLLSRLRPGDRAPGTRPPTGPDDGDGAPPDGADADADAPPPEPLEDLTERVRQVPEPREAPSWTSRLRSRLRGLRGLLLGSVGGAIAGLALGAVFLPTVAVQVAIALGVAGAAVGDVVSG